MPTKKQRRRREKSFRHEYDYVLVDADGNEVAVDPDEARKQREAREQERAATRPKKAAATAKASRPLREVQPPSWRRALKRGGGMALLMFVLIVFVLKQQSLGARVAEGAVYAVLFVPLTYWIDRAAYRAYQRRLERAAAKKS
ncbi:MAG TPA: hypothetical protein VFA05_11190 [Gaiellaceae bacterium]|nr:hypothetical protein [Gaiellaceae bacterium]